MGATYEEFREKHLDLAKAIVIRVSDAEELCRKVWEFSKGEILEDRNARFHLLSRVNAAEEKDTFGAMERIFGDDATQYSVDHIPLNKFLYMTTPILFKLELTDRIIAALNILEWGNFGNRAYTNSPIADLLNEILSPIEQKVLSPKSFAEVDLILDDFRKRFCERVAEFDKFSPWLCVLVEYRGEVEIEFKTFERIRDFCKVPACNRFEHGREENLKQQRYGQLRSRWNKCKKSIQDYLRPKLTSNRETEV